MVLRDDEIDFLSSESEIMEDSKNIEIMQELDLEDLVFREDHVIIHINMDINQLGRIKYVSKNCFKLFGYTYEDLLHANIKKLMPSNIADLHDTILLNYANSNQRFCSVKNQIESVAMTKDGVAILVSIMIKLISDIRGNIEFVALIKPSNMQNKDKNTEFAILDNYGSLTCCTGGLKEILRFNDATSNKFDFNLFL